MLSRRQAVNIFFDSRNEMGIENRPQALGVASRLYKRAYMKAILPTEMSYFRLLTLV